MYKEDSIEKEEEQDRGEQSKGFSGGAFPHRGVVQSPPVYSSGMLLTRAGKVGGMAGDGVSTWRALG
jgi:hypothetical protein